MAITRVSTIQELTRVLAENTLNKTSRISKISDESVVNGILFSNAKIAQKAMKDIAIIESNIFPDSAFGASLDTVAENFGIATRFSASGSSTYIRVVADEGTVYTAGTHVFSGSGINFDLEETLTIGVHGFGYAKVRSQSEGARTNVLAGAINSVTPVPTGHKYVINEYGSINGRDTEIDRLFRLRIKEGGNLASRGNLAGITQSFMKINTNVLDVRYQGINNLGQPTLAIVTQNGIDLTRSELNDLLVRGREFLNLRDFNPLNGSSNVELKNIEYQPIDISFRVQIEPSANVDQVRQDLQVAISKYLDFRFWPAGRRFEWDDVLQIVKDHRSVEYVPDTNFFPNQDINIDATMLPRVRGFLMLDLDGNIISNLSGTFNPIYYPANPDFSFQQTILASI